MKKILTLCFFAFALLIGTQSATAQNKILEINEKAANSAKALKAQLKFDEVALEKVYLAFKEYESKMASLKSTPAHGDKHTKDKNFIAARLDEGIKNAIGSELYSRYLLIKE